MNTVVPSQENEVSATPNQAALSWGLFWRYIFSWSSVLFFFAAIVCFFAYNWADIPILAKFSLIAGLMICSVSIPVFKGIEGFAGSAGLLLCGLLAGPLLAVYGQYYQTGANAWELFRTWAIFLLPLALIGRRSGLWLALWVVASLALFLFLEQRNVLEMDRYGGWMSFPFILAQIIFLLVWEGVAFFKPKESLSFLDSRWLPRLVAGLILFYLTAVVGFLIFDVKLYAGTDSFSLPLRYGLMYVLFLCFCAFYYTQKVADLVMIGMGLTSVVATGLMLLIDSFSSWSNSGSILLIFAAYILVASVVGVKILLFCHKLEKKNTEKEMGEGLTLKQQAMERVSTLASSSFQKISFAFGFGDKTTRQDVQSGKPEETSHWIIPLLIGLSAWVTLPFLLGGIIALVGSAMGDGSMIVLFLMVMGIGAAVSRLRGTFAHQAGLCLGLCGTIGAAAFAVESFDLFRNGYELLPAIALFAIGFFLIPNRIYRLLASGSFFLALFSQIVLKIGEGHERYYAVDTPSSEEMGFVLLVLVPIFTVFVLGLVHYWLRAGAEKRKGFLQTPLLSGAYLAFFVSSFCLYLSHSLRLWNESFWQQVSLAFGIAAGAGLLYFSFVASRGLRLNLLTTLALLGISLLLMVIGVKVYWVPAGFLLLCLARYAASLPLMGLAVIYLAVMTIFEYYNQVTTLLQKSLSLALLGLLLAVSAFVLHAILKAAFKKELYKTAPENSATLPKESKGLSADRFSRGVVFGCLCVFLLFFAHAVQNKETLLASGTEINLALRPVDPRSLMQGDYMIINFAIEPKITQALKDRESTDLSQLQGVAIVKIGEGGVAEFVRLDDGSPLAQDEIRLVYRRKSLGIQVSSGAFFFQEGHGKDYAAAQFAVLKVDEDGESLIIGLLDDAMERIRGGGED